MEFGDEVAGLSVVDPAGGHWVKFIVTRVPSSPEKPHGLDYLLTLLGRSGERLFGFDNARPVGRGTRGEPLADPMKLIVPMLKRFIATDREFAKVRRAAG